LLSLHPDPELNTIDQTALPIRRWQSFLPGTDTRSAGINPQVRRHVPLLRVPSRSKALPPPAEAKDRAAADRQAAGDSVLIYERNCMNKRRIVIRSLSAIGAASIAGIPLPSTAQLQKVDEQDPQAASLGYKDDTRMVDKKKFPKHDPSQVCKDCQFYVTEKEQQKLAPCTVLGGKAVTANGWCSAYLKKPG
jgi:hypothetical protein